MAKIKHIFVVDTCVLLHDPDCLYKFEDNDIYIPLACIDDLDEQITRKDSTGWAAREVFRNLDQYDIQQMTKGVVVNDKGGKLFIYNNEAPLTRNEKPAITRVNSDNAIIDSAHSLKSANPKRKVVIVSKDTGLRVRANSWGCLAENYKSDMLAESSLYQGFRIVEIEDNDDWVYLSDRVECNIKKLNCVSKLDGLNPNEFICFRYGNQSIFCWFHHGEIEFLDEKKKKDSFMGIRAKNMEQRFALEALADDTIPLVCLSGPAGSGKAQPLDSLILTEIGWKKMGEISIGEKVAGSNGQFCSVTGVYPQGFNETVKIIFSDGAEVECCKEHLWATKTELQRDKRNLNQEYTVKTTQEILESLQGHDGRKNHTIPLVKAINFAEKDLEIDPYLLGVILGDGGISSNSIVISSKDEEILNTVRTLLDDNCKFEYKKNSNCDYSISYPNLVNNPLKDKLTKFGLMGTKSDTKFIPEIYKFSGINQRIQLLQGLLDTDGYVSKSGSIYFYTVSNRLSEDIIDLVNSLGGIVKHTVKYPKFTYKGEYKNGKMCHVLCISLPSEIIPFKLTRKVNLIIEKTKYIPTRYISDVIDLGEKECQCISVNSDDHLYVTDNFILTHNTLTAIAVGLEKINLGVYDRIIVMKPMIAVGGKDIGFLPGSKLEKVSAWLGPIKDNIIQLTGMAGKDDRKSGFGGNSFEDMIEEGIIEVEAMAFIQGRSIPNSFIILDEAENVSPKEARMVVERCGKDSKVVLLGDMSQIENPYLDKHSCGLAHAINGGKAHEVAASIAMNKVERSILSAAASAIFKNSK